MDENDIAELTRKIYCNNVDMQSEEDFQEILDNNLDVYYQSVCGDGITSDNILEQKISDNTYKNLKGRYR